MRSGWTKYGTRRQYFTYIMSNNSMTLYIGVTNDLQSRVGQHKSGERGFTSRYHFDRLVYYEQTTDVQAAIAREKQLKGLRRSRKIEIIKTINPQWLDLSDGWGEGTLPPM